LIIDNARSMPRSHQIVCSRKTLGDEADQPLT
jgi:hypothetical protein